VFFLLFDSVVCFTGAEVLTVNAIQKTAPIVKIRTDIFSVVPPCFTGHSHVWPL